MNRLLITGADGFVGRWLVRAARAAGIPVFAVILPDAVPPTEWQSPAGGAAPVETLFADLRDRRSVEQVARSRPDGVVHLAAIASGAAARQDPLGAIAVNRDATVLLADSLSATSCPRFLFVSSAEVYGPGHTEPIVESAAVNPCSPYAASKAQAEAALATVSQRDGLRVVVARAFPHTGPGQAATYVLPALARRLKEAKRIGARMVKTGNLAAVRDFLDVRDVVRAYLLLLEHGQPGETYNVASGVGVRLSDCFDILARLIGVEAQAEPDASLLRPADIPVLIGDATRLRNATSWSAAIPFERTLQDLVDAQAD